MIIIQVNCDAKCKHCHFARPFYPGRIKRTKCMYGKNPKHFKNSWTFQEVADSDAKQIRLQDKACENFKLFGT